MGKKKTDRKIANKAERTSRSPALANMNPSFTKKGPGRYHVQGEAKKAD